MRFATEAIGIDDARRRAALAVVETIRGVRAVVDETTVEPTKRTDEQLSADVRSALALEEAVAPYAIHVAAQHGRVLLSGTVGSWQAKTILTDVAESVPGVVALDNDVTVRYAAAPSASEIVSDVKTRLGNDVWLDGDTFTVTAKGSVVRVRGVVATVGERSRVERDGLVLGVDKVDTSGIRIDWLDRDDQRRVTDYPVRSDAEVTKAVQDAFRYDPRLKPLIPQVEVHDGTATLRGSVDSSRTRLAAYEDAEDTIGVWNVDNEVCVEASGKPSERDLERAVRQVLSESGTLSSASSIDVAIQGGTIALRGSVASAADRQEAVSAAESVPGVSHVQDEITVKLPPEEIKFDIDNRLYWDPMVERNAVTVSVDSDGIATLSGTVASASEIRQASEDAVKAGAARVINLIKLRNHPAFILHGPVVIPHIWDTVPRQ